MPSYSLLFIDNTDYQHFSSIFIKEITMHNYNYIS